MIWVVTAALECSIVQNIIFEQAVQGAVGNWGRTVVVVTVGVLAVIPHALQGAVGNGRADVDGVEAVLVMLVSVLVISVLLLVVLVVASVVVVASVLVLIVVTSVVVSAAQIIIVN